MGPAAEQPVDVRLPRQQVRGSAWGPFEQPRLLVGQRQQPHVAHDGARCAARLTHHLVQGGRPALGQDEVDPAVHERARAPHPPHQHAVLQLLDRGPRGGAADLEPPGDLVLARDPAARGAIGHLGGEDIGHLGVPAVVDHGRQSAAASRPGDPPPDHVPHCQR
ncbi:hypothetical protein [Streptomyces tremellae]|uniref:Uncharacterized protein n=1 Tax=Streptomyces tremellae TaxID=1124239 RepID=A0ABP7FF48_9ACTN